MSKLFDAYCAAIEDANRRTGLILGGVTVLIANIVAAAISARPVLKLQPMMVFAGR